MNAAGLLVLMGGMWSASATTGDVARDKIVLNSMEFSSAEEDVSISFKDNEGNDFKTMWRSHGVVPCTATLRADAICTGTGSKLELHLETANCTFSAVFSGQFNSGPTELCQVPEAERGKARVPHWPIVYTTRVSVGAQGTAFAIHRDATTGVDRVYRLGSSDAINHPPGGLKVTNLANGAFQTIDPAATTDQLITVLSDGTITPAVAVHPNTDPILASIIGRANAKAIPLPPRADLR